MPTLKRRTYRQKREHKELGIKKSKEWSEFYGSRSWTLLREWYMSQHPLCENCLQYGISTPAEHLHHRTPFRLGQTKDDKWKLFLNPDNLESLCADCHRKIHEEINKTGIIPQYILPTKLEG